MNLLPAEGRGKILPGYVEVPGVDEVVLERCRVSVGRKRDIRGKLHIVLALQYGLGNELRAAVDPIRGVEPQKRLLSLEALEKAEVLAVGLEVGLRLEIEIDEEAEGAFAKTKRLHRPRCRPPGARRGMKIFQQPMQRITGAGKHRGRKNPAGCGVGVAHALVWVVIEQIRAAGGGYGRCEGEERQQKNHGAAGEHGFRYIFSECARQLHRGSAPRRRA